MLQYKKIHFIIGGIIMNNNFKKFIAGSVTAIAISLALPVFTSPAGVQAYQEKSDSTYGRISEQFFKENFEDYFLDERGFFLGWDDPSVEFASVYLFGPEKIATCQKIIDDYFFSKDGKFLGWDNPEVEFALKYLLFIINEG